MAFSREEKKGFCEAVESLKKYRRADLIDDSGRSLLGELYTDLLPDNHILDKCLRDNTTFLIGRKGTGKSTIFLKIEQEIRNRKNYISCYLDVKTIYESSQTQIAELDYLKDLLPKEALKKYLIERTFIQSVLSEIQKEISKKTDSFFNSVVKIVTKTKEEKVKEKLKVLEQKIKNNEMISKIEIPVLQKTYVKDKELKKESVGKIKKLGGIDVSASLEKEGIRAGIKTDSGITSETRDDNIFETEKQFSNVFLQVFQIKDVIIEIKEILDILNIRHLMILLDDFSEIDDDAIQTFVNVILAPLNNWSEEFIKFKVAAYPHRIYYGKIDPGKIDTINLDFYNLYSGFDRDKMEEKAIDFTRRLIEKRISYYTQRDSSCFFDTKKHEISEYYELLFNVSMNVPRIIGYILSYCYQNKIIFDKTILKTDIESASLRYYEEKILPFFGTTTYSLIPIGEKISILQLEELLKKIVERLENTRRKISTKDLKGAIYITELPYSSHFYFDPRFEEFIKTLELNFFISKYNHLSDKDGNPSSIYCINYGLAKKSNIRWGKPKGAKFRKYFIERPFNFNNLIKEFFSKFQSIHCVNPSCNKNFTIEDLPKLEFYNFVCNSCGGRVINETISEDLRSKLENIDKNKILPVAEVKILNELKKTQEPMYAREISEEIDYSKYLIAWRCKKLREELKLVERIGENTPYKYQLTEKGRYDYFN